VGRRRRRKAARQRQISELLTLGTGPEFLYLTTTGRRTGLPREIEIWFTEQAGRFHVVAEHGENAQWVRNLRADPAVSVRVGDRRFAARARVVDASAESRLWADVRARSEAKYGWGDGLVIELTPVDARESPAPSSVSSPS
jgi:deazaflavin-dependent oxidoreductase (nitroreductase family)